METKIELTSIEIRILNLLSKGCSNKKISKELFISPHTVKSYIAKIMHKLNASNRTNAVYYASKNGII